MAAAARWLIVVGGGSLVVVLSTLYHLQTAILNPLLPFLVGTLIFLPPLEAGAAFLVATSYTTFKQITVPGVTPVEIAGRLFIIVALAAVIVYVKERLRLRNMERLRLLAEQGTQRLQAVLDAAPEPMLVADEGTRIVLTNSGLEQLTGYARGSLVGQAVEVLVPQDYRAQHVAERDGYMHAPAPRPMGRGRDLALVRRDGSTVPVEISLSPYHDDERLLVVAAVVDISVRREMERQRVAALLAAEDAEARALASEKRASERSAFMSAAAHELRTPLTALHGYTEIVLSAMIKTGLLPQGASGPPSAEYAQERARIQRALPAMVRQTEKLERLVRLLLDVGRLEQGRLALVLGRADLGTLLREVVQTAQVSDQEHPINIGAVEDPLVLVFDTLRIEQVLTNLVHNAQQYSPPGSAIHVALRAQDGGALLSVSDEGPGIPAQEREQVFERFYQIGRTERSQGLGLGLYLVKMFVQMHGGWVRIRAGPGGVGTTVQVWLPPVPPQPPAAEGPVVD